MDKGEHCLVNGKTANGNDHTSLPCPDLPQEGRDKFLQCIYSALDQTNDVLLNRIQDEMAAYDPYAKGFVDASSLQRLLTDHYKQLPLDQPEINVLFRLFAVNQSRCHLIRYTDLINYLVRLKETEAFRPENGVQRRALNKNHLKTNYSTSQSPCYRRGDAKLVSDLEFALTGNKSGPVDVEQIRRNLAYLDRGRKGSLSRVQIEQVLDDLQLLVSLEHCIDRLLDRCSLIDNQYDWSTLANFLEKANGKHRDAKHDYSNDKQGIKNGDAHVASNTTGNLSCSPSFTKLTEQLKKLDIGDSGNVNAAQAQTVIQKYNNLHGLGLDSKSLHRILSESRQMGNNRICLASLVGRLQNEVLSL